METSTSSLRISQLGEYMSRHVADVFGTMLYLPVNLSAKKVAPDQTLRVSGWVGFAGETVNGAVYVHFPETFARCATAAMLGLGPDDEITPAQINNVIGELVNMLTGGLKSWLCDAGRACAMSTPTILRGKALSFESFPDVEQERLVFECAGDLVVVEVHARLA